METDEFNSGYLPEDIWQLMPERYSELSKFVVKKLKRGFSTGSGNCLYDSVASFYSSLDGKS